jgi:hypothetical protein
MSRFSGAYAPAQQYGGGRLWGLQDDVTADLMDSLVVPVFAEMSDQSLSAQISGQLHATASTSSRTRRRRMEAGGTESK